ASSSLLSEPSAPTSSAPSSGLKAGTGFGAVCSHREIAELSAGAPRLKSRLSSPPPVPTKRGRKADLSSEKESPVGKRGRAAPSSGSEDDGATLNLMRRRRSACGGLLGGVGQDKTEKSHSGGALRGPVAEIADVAAVAMTSFAEDALPPTVAESVLGDTLPSTFLISAASGASEEATGVHPVEGHSILVVGGSEPCSSDAGNAQGKGSAAKFELEAHSLENVELVANCSIVQVWSPLPYFSASMLNADLTFLYSAVSHRPLFLFLSSQGVDL
ncbi:hypothetical protein PanWU01x14_354730, partial [Parasponia andersonii]